MIEIRLADYRDPDDASAIGFLLSSYAADPMGGGAALPAHVRDNVANELAKLSYAFTFLAYVDGTPAGLVNCLDAFSTFNCKPLINIHDIVVLSAFRGQGISQQLLAKVEEVARQKGCCKITLEVLQGNTIAKNAYQKFGFHGYELDPAMGKAECWQKKI